MDGSKLGFNLVRKTFNYFRPYFFDLKTGRIKIYEQPFKSFDFWEQFSMNSGSKPIQY